MAWEPTRVEIELGYEFLTTTDLFWAVELFRGPLREDLLETTDYDRFPRDFLEVEELSTETRSTVTISPIPHVLRRYGVEPEQFLEALNLALRTAATDLREWRNGQTRSNVHAVALRCEKVDFDQSFEKEEQLKLDQFF